MATFDAKQYRDTVLKPYSRGEGLEQLREVLAELQKNGAGEPYARLDLNLLYSVPTPVSESELTEWRAKIEPALNKAAQLPAAKLLKQLLEILIAAGKPITEPSFWGNLQAEKHKLLIEALNTGLGQLRSEYPLDVVGFEELKSRLAAIGVTGVTDGSIQAAAQQHGLSVYPEIELPTEGMPPALAPIWRQMGQHTEFRSLVEVLLLHRPNDLSGVTFIDAFASAQGPITVGDIEQARLKSEQGRDSDALQDAQKLLGAVKAHCTDDAMLHTLVLVSVTELVSTQLGRGRPRLTVRQHLVDIGFDPVDASRLVAALATTSSSGPSTRIGLDTVREQLGAGQLAEAERTLQAAQVSDDEAADHAALTRQISQLKQRKADALADYHQALAARNFVAATQAVQTAITTDQGDETLLRLRDAIPPGAPGTLRVREATGGVAVEWSASPADGVTYTVVRSDRGRPVSVRDGSALASGITDTIFTDQRPVIGTPVTYGVFATRNGSEFSDGASAEITVLPAPTEFRALTDLSSAQLSWKVPEAAAGTVITQVNPDGRSLETEVNQGASLSVSNLVTGASYRFSARSWYLLDSGRQLSTPVSLTLVPRGDATAVNDLEVISDASGASDQLRASWTTVPGFAVELWQFPRHAALQEPRQVSAAELAELNGVRLTPLPGGLQGSTTTAEYAAINEVVRIAPLTVTDTGYYLGFSVVTGTAPRATGVITELFGDDLRVSWDWPTGDYIIELGWQDQGRPRTRRITKARYRADGGAKISGVHTVSDLTIATVVRVDGDEWVSSPRPVSLPSGNPGHAARYDLQIKRALLGGKISCQVTAESTDPGFSMPVDVVLKRGSVMPFSASDGLVVAQLELDFHESSHFEHTLTLPKTPSPFWLCVFSRDGSRLDPPPTTKMKG